MKKTQMAIMISGVLALLAGLGALANPDPRLLGLHEVFGYVFVLGLWLLAVRAARAKLAPGVVAAAVLWGLAVPVLGFLHYRWLHVASAIGALAWAGGLVRWLNRHAAATLTAGSPIEQAAAEFLAHKRIAITGVSTKEQPHGSNIVYQRLRERGYRVFAVNPHAETVEGDRCYHDLKSIPGGVDGVVIGTSPQHALETVQECAALGIRRVWMHRSFGTGSVSNEATVWARAHGIQVIDGGCPLMFGPTSDPGHKAMRWVFGLTGNVPRRVS